MNWENCDVRPTWHDMTQQYNGIVYTDLMEASLKILGTETFLMSLDTLSNYHSPLYFHFFPMFSTCLYSSLSSSQLFSF